MQAAEHRWAMWWLVVASGCWGLDTTLSAFALRGLHPAELLLLETVVGAGAVWAYIRVTGRYRRSPRLRPHLVLGIIEPGVAYLLFDVGLSHTSAVSGGLLLSTETLLSVALAVLVLGERVNHHRLFALLAGAAGVALISTGVSGGHESLTGDLLVLSGSATAACYFVVARRLPTTDDTLTGTAYQLLAAAFVAVGFAATTWAGQPPSVTSIPASNLMVGLSTGLVGIAIPFVVLNRSLVSVEASTAALVLNLVSGVRGCVRSRAARGVAHGCKRGRGTVHPRRAGCAH